MELVVAKARGVVRATASTDLLDESLDCLDDEQLPRDSVAPLNWWLLPLLVPLPKLGV